MKILGLETSGPAAGVALWEDGAVKAEYALHHTLTHSQTLLPMVEKVLADADWEISAIDHFAVDTGPGSFTGVRIGVCMANAMAAAWNKSTLEVDALEVLYAGVQVYPGRVCAMIDAKNGNIYAAQFENGACVMPPEPTDIHTYCEKIPAHTLLVGDGAAAYRELLEKSVRNAAFAPVHLNTSRAAALCWAAAKKEPKPEAAPLYLRPSQAERLYEERMEKKHG